MYKLDDDIVALATIPGKSALNVIRVSGQTTKKLYTKAKKNRIKVLFLDSGDKIHTKQLKKIYNVHLGIRLYRYPCHPKPLPISQLVDVRQSSAEILTRLSGLQE